MSIPRIRSLAVAGCLLATAACSRYSLDDVSQPDPDLAAPVSDASVLDREEMSRYSVATMTELLQGKIAGVHVRTDRTGQPSIQIRGRTSVIQESQALIMVDGLESNARTLLTMNPRDVARVEVLKDGSAAIYGVRGANGVLLITTRRAGG
jgi:TonB-dependent SusC/RagA subfamily outer membrane receptor